MMIKTILFSLCLIATASCENIGTDSDAIGLKKLKKIHSELKLVHGNFNEEFPEQLMAAIYLPATAKVLEIGANVGRNSCVIGKILNDSRNLVTLESNAEYIPQLLKNRNKNVLFFHIEPSALSKRALIQKEWITMPSNIVLPGYFKVKTITFPELEKKYKIQFDTLVADCEGALFYILKDEPKLLNNIKLIIVENDYTNPTHYEFVTRLFKNRYFDLVYQKNYDDKENFYQVWKK